MERGQKRIVVIWLALTLSMVSFFTYKVVNQTLQFDADIFNILDMGDQLGNVNKIAAKPFENRAMLLVSHKDAELSKAFLTDLVARLKTINSIDSVILNPNQQFDTAELTSFYGNYPLAFLSEKAQVARDNDDYGYLIDRYIYQLSQPANPLVSLTITDAPLLNLADWLSDRLTQSTWSQDGEFLYIAYEGNKYYPVFVEFDRGTIALDKIVQTVDEFNQSIKQAQFSDQVTVSKSGLIFHSAAVTAQARFETQLFGGLSLLGVLLLTLVSFRSVKPLFSISLIIAGSALAGMVALVLVFSKIHLLALVFAISLIGIAVDYGYHILLTAKFTGRTGSALSKYIAPALLMGGGTTLVSYLLLLILPIPLLHQVAVFVGAGIVFAVFTGLSVVAFWPGQASLITPVTTYMKQPFQGFYWFISGLVLLSIVAISQWKFNDDINIFNSTPASLIQNEILINKVVGNLQYPRFIYVKADDEEQMLQRFESVRIAIGHVLEEPFELRGIDTWVPSLINQQANSKWLSAGLSSNRLALITSYMAPENIDLINRKSSQFLTLDKLPEQIQLLYPAFSQYQRQQIGILSYMGPMNDETLNKINQQLDFTIQYYDQPTQLSTALTQLRHYISYFLLMAAVALCLLAMIRYGLKDGLVLALIPIVISVSALAATQLVLGYVTIFNLLGCILIMALSIDYVIFLREHGRMVHVLKAITLSAATSGMAFGIMVFSQTPAILHFGLTIMFGVLLAWVICQMIPPSLLSNNNLVQGNK